MNRFAGLCLLAFGLFIYFQPNYLEKLITFRSNIKGVKTEITPQTKGYYKLIAILQIILGLLFLLGIIY